MGKAPGSSPRARESLEPACATLRCARRRRSWSPTFPRLTCSMVSRLVRPSCLLTILLVASRFLCAADRLPRITVNDNRSPAGELRPVQPGATQDVRFQAGEPGAYYYWASTTDSALERRTPIETQLAGAFIVDPAGYRHNGSCLRHRSPNAYTLKASPSSLPGCHRPSPSSRDIVKTQLAPASLAAESRYSRAMAHHRQRWRRPAAGDSDNANGGAGYYGRRDVRFRIRSRHSARIGAGSLLTGPQVAGNAGNGVRDRAPKLVCAYLAL